MDGWVLLEDHQFLIGVIDRSAIRVVCRHRCRVGDLAGVDIALAHGVAGRAGHRLAGGEGRLRAGDRTTHQGVGNGDIGEVNVAGIGDHELVDEAVSDAETGRVGQERLHDRDRRDAVDRDRRRVAIGDGRPAGVHTVGGCRVVDASVVGIGRRHRVRRGAGHRLGGRQRRTGHRIARQYRQAGHWVGDGDTGEVRGPRVGRHELVGKGIADRHVTRAILVGVGGLGLAKGDVWEGDWVGDRIRGERRLLGRGHVRRVGELHDAIGQRVVNGDLEGNRHRLPGIQRERISGNDQIWGDSVAQRVGISRLICPGLNVDRRCRDHEVVDEELIRPTEAGGSHEPDGRSCRQIAIEAAVGRHEDRVAPRTDPALELVPGPATVGRFEHDVVVDVVEAGAGVVEAEGGRVEAGEIHRPRNPFATTVVVADSEAKAAPDVDDPLVAAAGPVTLVDLLPIRTPETRPSAAPIAAALEVIRIGLRCLDRSGHGRALGDVARTERHHVCHGETVLRDLRSVLHEDRVGDGVSGQDPGCRSIRGLGHIHEGIEYGERCRPLDRDVVAVEGGVVHDRINAVGKWITQLRVIGDDHQLAGDDGSEVLATLIERERRYAIIGIGNAIYGGRIGQVGRVGIEIVREDRRVDIGGAVVADRHRVADELTGIESPVAVGVSCKRTGLGHRDQDQRDNSGSQVECRRSSGGVGRVLAVRCRDAGAVQGVGPETGLVVVRTVTNPNRSEGGQRDLLVVAVPPGGVLEEPGCRITVVVDKQGGGRLCGDPHRAAVLRSGIVAAGTPADDGRSRETTLRDEREAPVVGGAVEVDGDRGVERGPGAKTGSRDGHLIRRRATRGDIDRGGTTLVVDGDTERRGPRVEENDGGGVIGDDRANGVVVARRPLRRGQQSKPAALVGRPDIAGEEIGLNRPVGGDDGALRQVRDEDRFTGVETVGLIDDAVGVHVDAHRRAVGSSHGGDRGVLDRLTEAGVDAHRDVVAGTPRINGVDLNRAGEQGTGVERPACPRDGHGGRRPKTVTSVVADGGRTPRVGEHIVDQRCVVAGAEHVAGVGATPRRGAVGEDAVTPDFTGCLDGLREIEFETVLPMVVVDERPVDGAGDGDDRTDGIARPRIEP